MGLVMPTNVATRGVASAGRQAGGRQTVAVGMPTDVVAPGPVAVSPGWWPASCCIFSRRVLGQCTPDMGTPVDVGVRGWTTVLRKWLAVRWTAVEGRVADGNICNLSVVTSEQRGCGSGKSAVVSWSCHSVVVTVPLGKLG